jgi:hypothetical protein
VLMNVCLSIVEKKILQSAWLEAVQLRYKEQREWHVGCPEREGVERVKTKIDEVVDSTSSHYSSRDITRRSCDCIVILYSCMM